MATTVKGYEEEIGSKIHHLNTKLDGFEAAAKTRRAQAEVVAIRNLRTAREHIERMLQDMKTARAEHTARARTDIDAALISLQKAIEEFRTKYVSGTETK